MKVFPDTRFRIAIAAVLIWISILSCSNLRTVYDESLAVGEMPVLLTLGADAVVRSDERRFVVSEHNRGRLHIRRSVTVLNQSGRDHTRLTIAYNPYHTPRNFKGAVYDRNGKRVRSLRRSDIEDHALITAQNWYSDYRYKRIQLMHDEYPYTVTYSYTIDFNQLLNWPTWSPQPRGTSVEYAEFVLQVADGIDFRTREANLDEDRIVITSGAPASFISADGLREYRWEIQNRLPVQTSRGGPTYAELQPELRISGSDFEVDGYAGSLQSWEDFAGWYRMLYSESMDLSDRDRERVREVVAASSDTLEIIRQLYRHVQDYTRYVNVSLGIGGWKPFPPTYVYENRHGECKALTHYLFVLLREAGIQSCPVLVQSRAGQSTVDPDFPESAFNHVFLAVPHNSAETGEFLWMEATSSTFPAGYAGQNNSGRFGLMVTEDGGEMVRIPDLGADENRIVRSGDFDLDENGNIRGTLNWQTSGYPHERIRQADHRMNTRDQRNFLDGLITWQRTRIGDFKIYSDPLGPEAGFEVQMEQSGFANRSGSRLFLTAPRPVYGYAQIPEVDTEAESEGKTDAEAESESESETDTESGLESASDHPLFRLDMAYSTTDSLVIRIPRGFRVESIPEPFSLENGAVSGMIEWRMVAGESMQHAELSVVITRHLNIRQKEFRGAEIQQLREVLPAIEQHSRRPLVLISNQ